MTYALKQFKIQHFTALQYVTEPMPLSQNTAIFTKKERVILTGFLFFVALLTTLDVYEDIHEGASPFHIIPEVIIILLATTAVVYLSYVLAQNRKESLLRSLQQLRNEKKISSQWKESASKFKQGIVEAIEQEMMAWGLSPAEQEIAFLLLKGFSIKEIAEIRKTSERTVRHQSTLIYRKSGLSGRAQLSAYFLEDILGPIEEQTQRPEQD